MPASSDDQAEQARQARLVQGAFERGRAALGAGDKADAMRWLDRAHRLAPDDGTIALVLASAAIGADNPKAVTLFSQVAADSDVRDAWLGLATARVLLRDLVGASAAVAEALSRHVVWLDIAGLAEQVARSTGAAGWCGLTSGGSVIVHPVGPERIEIRMDGRVVGDAVSVPRSRPARPGDDGRANLPDGAVILPKAWPHGRSVTVIARGPGHEERHLIGSPISLRAIGRVEGHVEAWKGGVRGWAWCPGDPDAAPRLALSAGRARKEIVATDAAPGTSGLAPLALPRSFVIPWTELPERDAPVHLRGRDGRDLPGSPIVASRADRQCRSKHRSEREPPVPQSRRRVQAGWRGDAADAVILVTHNDGGGVEQRIQASVASHAAQGRRAIVLRPTKLPNGSAGVIAVSNSLRDLVFELPREQPALLRLLRGTKPVAAELHHFLNHDPAVFETIRALGVPYDAHTHDYAWFCPRIALVGRGDRYCGEPAQAACETCVAEMGSFLNEDIRIPALLDRSQAILTGARQVIAPSHDAAARLARHFDGISSIVIPHEDDAAIAEPPPIRIEAGAVRVCIAGAIGLHKGFDVLLACARDAKQRALDLTFVVAGTTIDDQRLIDTGRVFVTGPYRPDEAVALIRAQKAALALLPSIWPETWCLGLTELWRAGLRVAAFDIGAPAERIRRTGRGFLLPLNLAPAAINDTLLKWARGRSSLPIRRSSAYKPTH